MQIVLLGMASVLLALWGTGSLAHSLGLGACGGLGFAPYAAAALIFTGMFFGPARDGQEPNDGQSEHE